MNEKIPPATAHIDRDALLYVLSLPQGRKVVWDILALAGLYHNPFNPDARVSDFNAGSLNVGLAVWADCSTVSARHTALMIMEQGNDHATDRPGADQDGSSTSGSGHTTDLGGDPSGGLDLGFDRSGRPLRD